MGKRAVWSWCCRRNCSGSSDVARGACKRAVRALSDVGEPTTRRALCVRVRRRGPVRPRGVRDTDDVPASWRALCEKLAVWAENETVVFFFFFFKG